MAAILSRPECVDKPNLTHLIAAQSNASPGFNEFIGNIYEDYDVVIEFDFNDDEYDQYNHIQEQMLSKARFDKRQWRNTANHERVLY